MQFLRLPPKLVRRLLLWPLPILLLVVYVVAVPLLLIATFVFSYLLPGQLRAVRTVGLVALYVFSEAAVIVIGFVLWVASGFGWKVRSPAFVTAHYWLMRWALKVLVGGGSKLFSLTIAREARGEASAGKENGPLIIMARHAGPADSLLLMHEVMSDYGLRPRIIVKDLLQLDPAFDLLLNRLPNRFIPSRKTSHPPDTVALIADLATGMGELDAFVIFPEGGNFTEKRRIRAIERLRESGHQAAVERAQALRNVLPPRPAGTLAAMETAPGADAVFVAHTGLDNISSIDDLWFELPLDNVLKLVWTRIPAAKMPATPEDREELLYRAWEGIDEWVEENQDDNATATR